jgi:hypothetical protein
VRPVPARRRAAHARHGIRARSCAHARAHTRSRMHARIYAITYARAHAHASTHTCDHVRRGPGPGTEAAGPVCRPDCVARPLGAAPAVGLRRKRPGPAEPAATRIVGRASLRRPGSTDRRRLPAPARTGPGRADWGRGGRGGRAGRGAGLAPGPDPGPAPGTGRRGDRGRREAGWDGNSEAGAGRLGVGGDGGPRKGGMRGRRAAGGKRWRVCGRNRKNKQPGQFFWGSTAPGPQFGTKYTFSINHQTYMRPLQFDS